MKFNGDVSHYNAIDAHRENMRQNHELDIIQLMIELREGITEHFTLNSDNMNYWGSFDADTKHHELGLKAGRLRHLIIEICGY